MTFKEFVANLELWKKVVQTILVTAPLLGLLGTAFTYTVKTIYHREIDDFTKTVTFMELARDSIIPKSLRVHGAIIHDLKILQDKHSGGFAVGLRYDSEEEKMYYRAEDGKKYEAHRYPRNQRWYYIKDGLVYYVYN